MQQLFVSPVGIVTEPNKLARIPPGALTSNAISCVMRSPGIIEANRSQSIAQIFSNTDRLVLFVVGKYILAFTRTTASGVWSYYWIDTNASNAIAYGPILLRNYALWSDTVDPTGRFALVTVRDRTILAASGQNFIWDTVTPATLADASAIRPPGLGVPGFTSYVNNSNGTALTTNTACLVVVVLRRKFADGYELFSAPSTSCWVANTGGGSVDLGSFSVLNGLVGAGGWQLGDVLEIYRTKSQNYTGTVGTNLGSDFFLSTTHIINSADVSSGSCTIIDTTPDQGLGEALYTNTAISGASGAALAPPTGKCLAYFRGHTFFSNYIQPPVAPLRAPVFWGFMFDSTGLPAAGRKNGIGERVVTGTTAIGSPTITGVSAANLVGIVVGQYYASGAAGLIGARVTAVGASTITLNTNASTAGSLNHYFDDVIEVTFDGGTVVRLPAPDPANFSSTAANALGERFAVTGLGQVYSTPLGGGVGPIPIPADTINLYIRYINGGNASGTSSFSLRATNGQNFSPQLPRLEINETPLVFNPTIVKNGFAWSEDNQPEYFCGTNVDIAGRGEIYATAATRDAVWFFCSDGLWRLSGTGGDVAGGYDWRLDPVDSTLIISGPQAFCVLRDNVFAWTTRGLVRILSDGTVQEITYGRTSDRMPPRQWVFTANPTNSSAQQFNSTFGIYLVADEQNGEVWIRLQDLDFSTLTWIYNVHTDSICRDQANGSTTVPMHAAWNPTNNRIYQSGVSSPDTWLVAQNSPGNLQTFVVELQPIIIDDPFTMRQFLQLEIAVESDAVAAGSATVFFNRNSGVTETRALTVTLGGAGPGTIRRTSFAVPRNSPATNNTISANITINGLTAANYARFLGAALKYSSPTDQRKDR